MDNKLERVSEIIDKEEIQSWKNGEIITISAGTGVGKSYFIKNTLFDYVKERGEKILFLIHRKNALNQFKIELENDGKLDVIDVKTYQHIKEKYKKNEEFNFSPYSYIVSDEFHYFMKDAEFDKFIDIALTAILEQKHCIRIFMSATGNDMETYFENIIKIETKKYNIENDNTFIRHLLFYSKQESLEAILNKHIQENKKAIIFTTAKKAYELYEKYIECSIFNCSESNDYYKFVDKEKINGILINEMFEELFLFTTTTMDTGVNIIDPLLHTVICELYNFDDIRQSIGRKRLIDSNDYIDLYVRERTNYEIEKSMNSLSNALNKAEVLKRFNEEEFLKRYPRDVETSGIYYMEFEDGYVRLKLNNLVLGSTYLRHKEYKIILENGYKNCIADWLDRLYMKEEEKYDYIDYENKINKENMLDILKQYIGRSLHGAIKEEFLNELYKCGLDTKSKSISKVQTYITNLGITKYNITTKRKRTKGDKDKSKRLTYWIVTEA